MNASLLLDVQGVSKYFGGLRANEDISFQVQRGTDLKHHRSQRRR